MTRAGDAEGQHEQTAKTQRHTFPGIAVIRVGDDNLLDVRRGDRGAHLGLAVVMEKAAGRGLGRGRRRENTARPARHDSDKCGWVSV